MRSMSKLVVPLAFVGLFFAPFSSMASTDVTEDVQRMMEEGINDECHDHARVRADAEWAAIERGSRSESFSSDFKEALFQVEKAQCILIQQILVLEMVQEELPQDERDSLGVQESLQALREKLISTFPH